MKNKKRFLGLICALFVAICSFVVIPLTRIDSAKADSTNVSYTYTGSNLILPITYCNSSGTFIKSSNGNYLSDLFSVDVTISKVDSNTLNLNFVMGCLTQYSSNYSSTSSDSYRFWSTGPEGRDYSAYYDAEMDEAVGTALSYGALPQIAGSGSQVFYFRYEYSFSSPDWVPNIYKVEIYGGGVGGARPTIRYYDTNDNYFLLAFTYYNMDSLASAGYVSPYVFERRTYYITSSLSDNQFYESGYQEGYNNGYLIGEDVGYNNGYNSGFSNGERTGFGNGYNEGLETASEATFLGLIGSTIDAPIKAFRGLFNFELLGVNMVSLITGLFTLCVIVCIVKLVLGGK